MDERVPIPRALSSPEGFRKLSRILAHCNEASRIELGRRVCTAFDFLGAHGAAQATRCHAALWRRERAGRIVLPAPRGSGGHGAVAQLNEAVPAPVGLPVRGS